MLRIVVYVTLVVLAVIHFTSCASETPTGPTSGVVTSRSNFQPDSTVGWLYYSVDGDSIVPASEVGTSKWDIRFAYLLCCGATRRVDVFLNSGNAGVGVTQGAMWPSRFDALTEYPTTAVLKSDDTTVGRRIVPAEVIGSNVMFVYDITTHTLSPSPDQVLLFKTPKGTYVKFQFTSIYQDAVTSPNLFTPLGYYHFRYSKSTSGKW